MKKFMAMFGTAALLAGMMMIGGCGDDNAPKTTTSTKDVTSSVQAAPAGTKVGAVDATAVLGVAGTPVTAASAANANATISILGGTAIVLYDAAGKAITAKPSSLSINTTVPTGSAAAATPAPTGFTVDSAAGLVDFTFAGYSKVEFNTPVTITIPVTTTKATVPVSMSKDNGAIWTIIDAAAKVSGTAPNQVATVTTSSLCYFGADVVLKKSDATGATGTAGSSFK